MLIKPAPPVTITFDTRVLYQQCVNMELMFKSYDQEIKKILAGNNSQTDWAKVLENHRAMLKRIQHERLIHLLVTIFVGMTASISAFIALATKTTTLLLICLPLLMLFVGYLFHYRFLENTTQRWYKLEDKIKTNC